MSSQQTAATPTRNWCEAWKRSSLKSASKNSTVTCHGSHSNEWSRFKAEWETRTRGLQQEQPLTPHLELGAVLHASHILTHWTLYKPRHLKKSQLFLWFYKEENRDREVRQLAQEHTLGNNGVGILSQAS